VPPSREAEQWRQFHGFSLRCAEAVKCEGALPQALYDNIALRESSPPLLRLV